MNMLSSARIRLAFSRRAVERCLSGGKGGKLTVAPPLNIISGVGIFLLGGVAGGLGSLVGLGGAFIVIPALTGPIGMLPHHAIGTSMAAVLATSIGATAAYSKKSSTSTSKTEEISTDRILESHLLGFIPQRLGYVDVSAALVLIVFSTLFAVVGARISRRLSAHHIKHAQGLLMIAISPTILLNDQLKNSTSISPSPSNNVVPHMDLFTKSFEKHSEDARFYNFVANPVFHRLALTGSLSGLAAGFFGIGGGAVTVPALVYFLDFDYRAALATSLFVMVPTAFTGAATHLLQSTVAVTYAIPLGVGTAGGSYFGGYFSQYVDDDKLKKLFSLTMLVLGLRTFVSIPKI